nr:MAG TPA: Prominin [Caudoviricetes sp.]
MYCLGLSDIFYCRCCGWCSLPLHHQMVGRR